MSALLERPRTPRRGSPPPRRRALAAVTALFVFDGAVFGSWAARIPDVTAQIGASHTTLGLALLCISLGALASMQITGALCARSWYFSRSRWAASRSARPSSPPWDCCPRSQQASA